MTKVVYRFRSIHRRRVTHCHLRASIALMESVCGTDTSSPWRGQRHSSEDGCAHEKDTHMNSATLHQKLLPALLGGTSRHPIPSEGIDNTLGMLGLMGQALRFERPATPDSFSVEPEIRDGRKILADRLRRPLIR